MSALTNYIGLNMGYGLAHGLMNRVLGTKPSFIMPVFNINPFFFMPAMPVWNCFKSFNFNIPFFNFNSNTVNSEAQTNDNIQPYFTPQDSTFNAQMNYFTPQDSTYNMQMNYFAPQDSTYNIWQNMGLNLTQRRSQGSDNSGYSPSVIGGSGLKASGSGSAGSSSASSRKRTTYKNEYAYDNLISKYAREYGVEEDFVRAIIKQESSFDPNALGPMTKYGQAKGLMQLMPDTADSYGVTNPYDPEQNIRAGIRMLSNLSKRYNGDKKMILAAYNWGSGNLAKNGYDKRPAQTRKYIENIMIYYNEYKAS